MYDKMEKIGNSLIQHGKYNDRIYLMKINGDDFPAILGEMDRIRKENNYSKIFAKVQGDYAEAFLEKGFFVEAEVPGFYEGNTDGFFLSKYFTEKRMHVSENDELDIEKNIYLAKEKHGQKNKRDLDPEYTIRKLVEADTRQLSELYKIVFPTYPFPIHDPAFLVEAMNDNVEFFGIIDTDGKLVAASSAEKYDVYSNVEMTDFATNPEHLGQGLALFLLDAMEAEMQKQGFKTLYTIARSHSAGMNITFSKNGYLFAGTLINNTNISGRIESMNVWYKKG